MYEKVDFMSIFYTFCQILALIAIAISVKMVILSVKWVLVFLKIKFNFASFTKK